MSAHYKRLILWTAIALVVLTGVVFGLRPQPVPVETLGVATGPMRIVLNAEGETRVHDVFVLSAPVTGRMRRIEGHVGDAVVAGESVLVSIEPGDPTFLDQRTEAQASAAVKAAKSARDLAAAEVERVKADLEFSQVDYERSKNLITQGTITRRELDAAARAYKTNRASLATAQAGLDVRTFELEQAQAQLLSPATAGRAADCACIDLTAPVDGSILTIFNDSERVVQVGEPLLEIGDTHDLEIVSDYLSTDAVKIESGQAVSIDNWGGAVPLQGRVRYVEPSGFTKVSALGIEEQRVNVIIDLTSPPADWRRLGHGYQVETNVVIWAQEKVLTVPLTAIFRDGKDWAVFVDDEGVAAKVVVQLGQRNGMVTQVLQGLTQGTQVILHPSDRVADGVRLRARRAEQEP